MSDELGARIEESVAALLSAVQDLAAQVDDIESRLPPPPDRETPSDAPGGDEAGSAPDGAGHASEADTGDLVGSGGD